MNHKIIFHSQKILLHYSLKIEQNLYTLGRIVYDIIFINNQAQSSSVGGSVLNSSISLQKLGAKNVKFITCISNDYIGKIEKQFILQNQLNTNLIQETDEQSVIALAFKSESTKYQFYGSTDFKKILENFPKLFQDKDILLVGDISDTRVLNNLKQQLELAKQNAIIYYDPNVRPPIHHEIVKVLIENATIFRMSSDDKEMLNLDDQQLLKLSEQKLILITYIDHVEYYFNSKQNRLDFIKLQQNQLVSTIGAGDSFNAGFLYQFQKLNISKNQFMQLTKQQIEQCIISGIKVSQHVCQIEQPYVLDNFKI